MEVGPGSNASAVSQTALGWPSVIYMARGWLNMAMILHCGNDDCINRLSGLSKEKLAGGDRMMPCKP